MTERRVVLVDCDHCLSDAAWRDHLIPRDHLNGDWGPYYAWQGHDRPIQEMVDLVRGLAMIGREVSILTARSRQYEEETSAWLRAAGVAFVQLIMRPVGDKRSSAILKFDEATKVYSVQQIALVIDDRDDCLAPFRQHGVSTVMVSAKGRMTDAQVRLF